MRRQLLKIAVDAEGIFRERPNRFLGIVDLPLEYGGPGQKVHVHDPGRLMELLFPGNRVLLIHAERPGRKTAWTVAAAWCEGEWVLINSGLHHKISSAILADPEISPFGRPESVDAEVNSGNSRLDYRMLLPGESRVWVEVKGCTLSRDGVALFPDAPTKRGVRHVRELVDLKVHGDRAALLILVFRQDVICFSPNYLTDAGFARAFAHAVSSGVEVYPLVCSFTHEGDVCFEKRISVCADFPPAVS